MMFVEDEKTINQRVGRKLKDLRRAYGLKAKDLAARSGISQSLLSKIEHGQAAISIAVLSRLGGVLGRPISYFFQLDEEIPKVLGTMTTVPGPENRGLEFFAREVERRSEGRIWLIPLKATQLDSSVNNVRLLEQGLIDLFIEEMTFFHHLAPAVNIMALPYSFQSEAHLEAFLTGDFFEAQIKQRIKAAGLRFINRRWNWRRGLERVLLSSRPITRPEQVKGLKVRVPAVPVLISFWRAMGAEPVVIPWPQVKAAWLKAEIDLLPTHKAHLFPLGFCQRGRYVSCLGDLPPALPVVVNETKYKALPPTVQKALEEACDAAGDYFSAEIVRSEADNEAANMARYKVAYLKVDLAPWKNEAERVRRLLISSGELDGQAWAEVERLSATGGVAL
ncbi:MAG: TRAP transporter substrate-binding protein DctP [Thermodesulfobacteriota bacterium]